MKNKLNIDFDKEYVLLAVLSTVAAIGLISVVVLAPNVLKMIKIIQKNKYKKLKKEQEIKRGYYITQKSKDLIKQGLLKKDKNGNISLTNTGQFLLDKYQIKEKRKGQKPDGKWRIIIFDIKEKSRKKRDYFRAEIAEAGFKKLQGSVWISPYPNEEFIELLRTELEFSKSEIIYFEAGKISCPEVIKKLFKV